MRNVLVVAWKEFRTFFQTPIGYLVLLLFTLIAGWFFFQLGAGGPFFLQKESSVRGLLTWLPWLFLFLAPAITMRMWAEERRTGTIETLLTLPLTDWQIVVGKYLAVFGLVATWLLCLSPMVAVVAWFGEPDPGPIWGGFFGALLLGGAYAAIGIAASAVTENQIIALVAGIFAAFFFLLVGFDPVIGLFPDAIGAFLYNLSLMTHFQSITKGVIDSRDLLYYFSFILFFLFINAWAVRKEKGRGVSIAIAAAILVLANYLAVGHFFRIDLTENQRYTLAADTKRVLGELDDDLRLTAYLSKDVPAELSNVRRDIEDLVREFESYSGSNLHVEIVDPGEADELAKAAEAAGVIKIPFQAADASKYEVREGYSGLIIEYGDKAEKIPVIANTATLEYDLVRRIAKITRREPVKVAWQINDPFGGMQIPNMPRPPSTDRHTPTTDLRALDQAFKQEYDTTTVDLKSKVPDGVMALVLCNVEGLDEVQMFHLDQYLMRGGGLIVLADGTQPMSFGGMGQQGSPFMRTASEKVPDEFLSHYGIKINKDLVLDLVCLPVPMPVPGLPAGFQVQSPYPPAVVAIKEFIDQSHPVSARFRDLGFLFCSSISLDPKPGVKAWELVKSSDHAKKLEGFIDVSFQQLQDENSETFREDTFNQQFTLAGLLEGNFQSYYVAHEVPKAVSEGDSGDEHGADDGHGHDAEAENPFGNLLEPGEDDTAHAKEHDGAAAPAQDPPKKPESDGAPKDESGGGGGPRTDESQDVPGGGLVRAQEGGQVPPAPPAPAAPAADAKQTDPTPAEIKPAESTKPPFEYLKASTAPAKIFVFGTSEFAVDDLVAGGRLHNGMFVQSIVDYMAAEGLSSLRAKRLADGTFAEPSDAARNVARALGWFAAPAILLGLGLFVYAWRRKIRPARARRRMSSAGTARAAS